MYLRKGFLHAELYSLCPTVLVFGVQIYTDGSLKSFAYFQHSSPKLLIGSFLTATWSPGSDKYEVRSGKPVNVLSKENSSGLFPQGWQRPAALSAGWSQFALG